jgi:hypothetical protein
MWLSATNLCLGFQLITTTGLMSNDKKFIRIKKNSLLKAGC